jgi:hypothetical protein
MDSTGSLKMTGSQVNNKGLGGSVTLRTNNACAGVYSGKNPNGVCVNSNGESGYDYNEAASMAYHAKTSAEYFKRENMAYFKRWLDELEDAKNENSNYRLVIYPTQYSGQSEDCNLRGFGFVKTSDVIDACGGSCYLSELPGKELTVNFRACRVATFAEIDAITEAFKTAAATHEKKVDNYLKRYGMSKVDTWTYWRDA